MFRPPDSGRPFYNKPPLRPSRVCVGSADWDRPYTETVRFSFFQQSGGYGLAGKDGGRGGNQLFAAEGVKPQDIVRDGAVRAPVERNARRVD
ncbi:MAG: hypothetical protein FWF86_07620, partial [Clostridia bacterium]|nr:hypothetical protein [Clostridia bacterium]